jgi:hypothetical protein
MLFSANEYEKCKEGGKEGRKEKGRKGRKEEGRKGGRNEIGREGRNRGNYYFFPRAIIPFFNFQFLKMLLKKVSILFKFSDYPLLIVYCHLNTQ